MSEPLLDVRNLDVVFRVPGDSATLRRPLPKPLHVRAVANVSLQLERGETLGLVGESGSGKSTIAQAIMRLVEIDGGSIHLDGIDLTAARGTALRTLRRRIAMVHQDPFASLNPRRTIAESIREPMEVHGLRRGTRRDRVFELLEMVGLDARFADRYPRQLSGGQRQRVCIARALASDPEILILDEATASLDVSVQAQILNLLRRLQRDHGLAYLFIAHDLAVVEHMSDRVMVLYLGRAMEVADRDSLFIEAPAAGEHDATATPHNAAATPQVRGTAHPYTAALLSAIPPSDPLAEGAEGRMVLSGDVPSPLSPPSGCVFRTRCPIAVDECAEVVPPAVEVAPGHESWCLRVEHARAL